MAKESFDKEIQLLRLFMLTSGAYNRQQLADRLGLSVHSIDKTLRRLKDIVGTIHPERSITEKEFTETLRYRYYDTTSPILLFLFRAKSLKESESQRISTLVAAMNERAYTAMELLEICGNTLPSDAALPDEKTIRADVKYLEQVGVIRKESGPRPYRYRIDNDLVQQLTSDELIDLYDFVDIMANTQIPSVQGYLLREGLLKFIQRHEAIPAFTEPFLYKYHYPSRILDEAHLFTLLQAIHARRKVRFTYFSPKSPQTYTSQNTNPLYERDLEGKQEQTLPLAIIYDHQYGRYYLIGYSSRYGIRKFRMEGITQLVEDEPVEEALFQAKRSELEHKIQHSWLVDTGHPVNIRIRFFTPEPPIPNFIHERVLLQGQWGMVSNTTNESFIFEITVNGTLEIKPWIRSFGSSCEVLEPRSLREEMMAEWKEIRDYYAAVRENI
ncbi:WYL domain-containing protein [Paenibacillus selenitireducens]|uniref:WYL domain-containing protein n=1 Tax=Paenibacillus selenitireducens TaxID=1324314 RepID=A0A1T2XMI5_9BACL|nr:WYL domain-containing protein [Paenibacillus selenitireducens]OPA81061.1 WYL domain-containing protein [Paenibacillus selenitireducens]